MLKHVLALALLSITASTALAQAASAPAPAQAASASTPRKHRLHAPNLRHGAKPATNPQASPDKLGGS